jgi:hypothetical protein
MGIRCHVEYCVRWQPGVKRTRPILARPKTAAASSAIAVPDSRRIDRSCGNGLALARRGARCLARRQVGPPAPARRGDGLPGEHATLDGGPDSPANLLHQRRLRRSIEVQSQRIGHAPVVYDFCPILVLFCGLGQGHLGCKGEQLTMKILFLSARLRRDRHCHRNGCARP